MLCLLIVYYETFNFINRSTLCPPLDDFDTQKVDNTIYAGELGAQHNNCEQIIHQTPSHFQNSDDSGHPNIVKLVCGNV